MNISTSECSSGCESGWTTYLDQLSNSTNPHKKQNHHEKGGNVHDEYQYEDDDEDLSMVSDASSRPPNQHGYEPHFHGYEEQKSRTKETRMMMKKKKQHSLCLDDTASSPFLHHSEGNADHHENHESISTPHYEEESMPRKNLGFFKSSTKGRSGSSQGRKRQ